MNWLIEHKLELWAIVTSTVTVASLIVKLTPSLMDDTWLAKVMWFIQQLALTPKAGKIVTRRKRK